MEWDRKHEQELVQTQNHNMVERIANKIFWNREAARSNIAQVNRFLMMVTLFLLFVNFQIDFTAQTLVGLKYLVAYINSNEIK